jgi:hypothetical protein
MYSKTTSLLLMLAAALPGGVFVKSTAVPANLEVPAGNSAYLTAHAEGTQNYVCVLAAEGFNWQFFGPQATLFDDGGQQVATHFLSPNPDETGVARATWQHSADTSAVWAGAIANSTNPAFVAPGAIPWLLLRAVGTQPGPTFGSTLSDTTYIQRINTAGGVAPADGCRSAKDGGKKALVPYSADYVFYRAN